MSVRKFGKTLAGINFEVTMQEGNPFVPVTANGEPFDTIVLDKPVSSTELYQKLVDLVTEKVFEMQEREAGYRVYVEPQSSHQQAIQQLKDDIAAARATGIQSAIETAVERLNSYMDFVESKNA